MARLRKASPVGNDDTASDNTTTNTTGKIRTSPRKKAQKSYADINNLFDEDDSDSDFDTSKLIVKLPNDSARTKRQIKLAPLKASESSSELRQKIVSPESSRRRPLKDVSGNGNQGLPKLNAFASRPLLKPSVVVDDNREEEAEVEESVWCGSDANSSVSDDDLPSPRKLWPSKRSNAAPTSKSKTASSSLDEALQGLQGLSIKEPKQEVPQKLTVPKKTSAPSDSYSTSSQDSDNLDAILRFSPPRLVTRPRRKTPERAKTPPPASPSKSKLVSPSKPKPRIPTPPSRQSLDAFWSPNEVNSWNDKHSPRKTLGSPKKNPIIPLSTTENTSPSSPSSSSKKISSSPAKDPSAQAALKAFSAQKHSLAESFLLELDRTLTSGAIASLSASTGGVRIVWSKTLNSTAGRANWRRETIKTRNPSSPEAPQIVVTHHHASIELASKVISTTPRLFNVLAHEFCHLANFMISNVKDQPHGASFKAWGAKCTAAFGPSHGVQVTTKHSYAIDYKYVWRCSSEDCGAEFKRHSKSIDPGRQRCGSCRGVLVQVKPIPRGGVGKVGGYAGFVKEVYAEVKRGLPEGASQKEVMEAVGRRYREKKERKAKEEDGKGIEGLARAMDVVVLDD